MHAIFYRTPRLLPPHLQYWKSSPRICQVPREHMALLRVLPAVPPRSKQGGDDAQTRRRTGAERPHTHAQDLQLHT